MSDYDELPTTAPGGITAGIVEELIRQAAASRQHSYAPYSSFHVGAAVLTSDGRVFTGANVENASYGLTLCAERVAIFAAVAQGHRRPVALAVSADPAFWPCGACRQVMAEFAKADCIVLVADGDRLVAQTTVGEILPHSFALPPGSAL